MKRTGLTILLFFAFTLQIIAQNYQTFNSGEIYFFENFFHDIKPVRIDSVHVESDSVLYPFYVILDEDFQCYSPNMASWIGSKIIVKENGDNLFFNKNNDTICIKTRASEGNSWTALQLTDSTFIQASVVSHDVMTFMGIQDSVKTIVFQAYNNSMEPEESNVNGLEICLSKNHGLVKTLDFYLMPGFQINYIGDPISEHTLVGLSSIQTGVQNLTWLEVMDFQPGDEIHVGKSSSSTGPYDNFYSYDKSIFRYLERTDYGDSVVYVYSHENSYGSQNYSYTYSSYSYDTISETITPDENFDKLPWEAAYTDDIMTTYYMENEEVVSKYKPQHLLFHSDEYCWQFICVDGCVANLKYIKGLGGPYYECTNDFSYGGSSRTLVYYKKGDISWGQPFSNLGNTSPEVVSSQAEIFPNPAKDEINIHLNEKPDRYCTIRFYDINGKILKEKNLSEQNSRISISEFTSGILYYIISDEKQDIRKGSLIVE